MQIRQSGEVLTSMPKALKRSKYQLAALLLASAMLVSSCTVKIRTGNLGLLTSSSSITIELPNDQTSFLYTVGQTLSITPSVLGSASSFSIAPALPEGLSLNASSGVISGTATSPQSELFYVLTALDSSGNSSSFGLAITIYTAPAITVAGSPFTEIYDSAIAPITPTLSSSVSQVTINPALPPGLSLNSTTGVISGTPSAVSGQTSYTLTAQNPAGSTATTTIQIQVNDSAPLISYTGSPFVYDAGNAVSITPATSYGTMTIAPPLTNGLSMTSGGVISGTATGTLAQTTYTITATNLNSQTTTTTITIQILAMNTPIQLVQTATTALNQYTITMPAASTAGDLIVLSAWLMVDQVSDLSGIEATDSFGNTYALATSNSYNATGNSDWDGTAVGYTAIFYAKNITVTNSTPITITLTLPNVGGDNNDDVLAASEFSGINQTNPLDQVVSNTGGNSSTPETVTSGTTGTTSQAYELLISSVGGDDDDFSGDNVTFTESGSPEFTELASQLNDTHSEGTEMGYAITNSTGAFQTQWTASLQYSSSSFLGFASALVTFRGLQSGNNASPATHFVLTSNAQSVKTHACTSVTIQSENASNQLAVTNADQTLSLTGSGLLFFSDSACTQSITSLNWPNGTMTSDTFYFEATTPGTIALNINPSIFSAVTQTETVTYVNYTWLGTAGDGNWTTNANWSNGSYPTGNHMAVFDGNCTSCNATMNSGVTDDAVHMYAQYTGAVTQATGSAVSIGGAGFTEEAGTWNVGSGTFTNNGNVFTLEGGTFNLGSATFLNTGYVNNYFEGGSFTGTTGTFQFGNGTSSDVQIKMFQTGGTFAVPNMTFDMYSGGVLLTGNFYVTGNLTFDNTNQPITTSATTNAYVSSINGYPDGDIYVAGNVNLTSGGGGSANIILNGTGAQTITGTTSGALPNIEIAQGSGGAVDLSGTIQVEGSWTYTSGTVNAGASTVSFGEGNATLDQTGGTIDAPTMSFWNVLFNNQAGTTYDDGETVLTMTVANNLTLSGSNNWGGYVDGNCQAAAGYIYVAGDFIFNSGRLSNFCALDLIFTGANSQTVAHNGGTIYGGASLILDKTGGSATLETALSFQNGFLIEEGTLNLNGYQLSSQGIIQIDTGGVINCDGGCGSAPVNACGAGSDDLSCSYLYLDGGTVNP